MLKATYIGSHNWSLEFDSKTEVILSSKEILEIVEQHEEILYEGKTHGNILHEPGSEIPLHQD